MATPGPGKLNTSFSITVAVLALELDRQAALAGNHEIRGAILVAIGVAADHDRLGPAGHQPRHVPGDDRLAEDDAAQDVADGAVGRAPHLLEIELLHARFVGRDGGAFDPDAVALDGLGGVDRHLVGGLVAVLDREVVIFEVDVEIGMDQLVADIVPDDAGHLVAIELDDRIGDLDLVHRYDLVLSGDCGRGRFSAGRLGAAITSRRRRAKQENDVVGAGTDHSKQPGQGGPAIVLVRPQLAVNIGMAARAMANFGLSDLRLVAPKGGWPRTDKYREDAEAAAAGALHLLDRAQVFPRLEDAVADLTAVFATTARERGQGKRVLPPDRAMAEWAAPVAAGEKRGILFGPERTGLDNDEIALADAIVTFPVDPAYGSLNLAQAVLLVSYEWLKHKETVALPFGPVERSPPAERGAVLSFFGYLEAELTAAGYFKPDDKQPVMRRNLRNIFHRIGMTEQDVRTLRGAVVRLVEGPRREGGRREPRTGADPAP